MPLTSFQKEVLTVLAANRSEESHFAGGVLLNAPDESARYSHDFDIFHELANEVARASEQDVTSLRANGFSVVPVARYGEWETESTFRRAKITGSAETVEIDWAADSAFRFFPIERDSVLGWRLHHFDAAVNKALALAARTETRDYIDIIEFGKMFPLAAICWAGCGKDPGFTPISLLEMLRRFARIDPLELRHIAARALDPKILKASWVEMSDEAEAKMKLVANATPALPTGIAFVDSSGKPGWIGDNPVLRIHAPSIRGCWPTIHLDGK